VAGLRPEKDHLNLLSAFLLLLKKYSEVSLHLIGKDYYNDYSKDLKKFINENNLKEHVFIYDSCFDIDNILKQASIGVLSSKTEGLPISLLEYGLAKLPVVVTDVGDCSKLVVHDFNGKLVKKENSYELMKSLLFLLKNEEKSFSFGVRLEKKVCNNYSLDKYIEKLIEIYGICL
jgi:glycosyltransferase involved in cell wall biosynthesis